MVKRFAKFWKFLYHCSLVLLEISLCLLRFTLLPTVHQTATTFLNHKYVVLADSNMIHLTVPFNECQ